MNRILAVIAILLTFAFASLTSYAAGTPNATLDISATAILSIRSMISSTRCVREVQLFFCHEELATAPGTVPMPDHTGAAAATAVTTAKHCIQLARRTADIIRIEIRI